MLSFAVLVILLAVLRADDQGSLDEADQASGHPDHQANNRDPGCMKLLVQKIADEPTQHGGYWQSDTQLDHFLCLYPALFPVALLVCHRDHLTAKERPAVQAVLSIVSGAKRHRLFPVSFVVSQGFALPMAKGQEPKAVFLYNQMFGHYDADGTLLQRRRSGPSVY